MNAPTLLERRHAALPVKVSLRICSMLAAAAVLLASCASGPDGFAPPRVALTGLASLPPLADKQRYRVSLTVENLGTEPLVVEELTFMLRLGSEGRLEGEAQDSFTLPALDNATREFVIESDIVSSASRLRAAQGAGGGVPYELLGELVLVRVRSPVAFEANGEISLSTAER